jgi:hypothetical protein
MIATGNVRRDAKGNVTEFQTYEAHSTSEGVIVNWRKVSRQYTIGHPFRSSDVGKEKVYFRGWQGIRILSTPSTDARTRTMDNLQQTDEIK